MLQYADLISGGFGLAGSIVLGWPALQAVRGKADWEKHRRLEAQQGGDPASDAALVRIGRHVEGKQLGGAKAAAAFNLIGYALLAGSFIFLMLASLDRAKVL